MEEARGDSKIEPFDREFFTGMLGVEMETVNGLLQFVVLKYKKIHSVYMQERVVAESKPEDELAETSAKFQTMLKALGLNDSS